MKFLHKYMRAIGFSTMESHKKLQELLTDVVIHSDRRSVARNEKNIILSEFCKDFAEGLGIAVSSPRRFPAVLEFLLSFLRNTRFLFLLWSY